MVEALEKTYGRATDRLREPAHHAVPIATAFAELSERVASGARVYITTNAGTTIEGRIASISASLLIVRGDEGLRTLSEADVWMIERSHDDSTWNGIENGMGIGLLTGAVVAARLCKCAEGMVFGLAGAAAGAATGAAIDAAVKQRIIIYRRARNPQ